jgi:iron complex outermembrane receptor protein
MRMTISAFAMVASLLFPTTSAFAEGAAAAEATDQDKDILVIAQKQSDTIENAPSTRVSTDEARIAATVNAVSVEDTLKYLPSLVIRKRHIGDNFTPLATRTSGLGSSARSLIFADGAILSALIGNNNGNGSPRWTLVTPEEIAKIDVLYGPFSAAYSGNSIGTVVNITTRLPDKLEARATVLTNVQDFSLYGTDRTLATWQISGSVGDRFGPLALFASVTRTNAKSQPVSVTTISGTTNPTGTTGGYADKNRLNTDIRVLGAGGLEHHIQDTIKLKSALDLGGSTRLTYVLGIWRDDTSGTVDSYLKDTTTGAVSYVTTNSGVATGVTTGFNAAVYTRDALHLSHAVTLAGDAPRLDWQVVGALYDYARDIQQGPSTATSGATLNRLPAAFAGGPGTIQRQDGTGWLTLDARAGLKLGENDAQHISFGAHADRYVLRAETFLASNWTDKATQGALSTASRGRTQTLALWAQDEIRLLPTVTLTLGARQEWWRAWSGYNLIAGAPPVTQPKREFSGFSPKASLEWQPVADWSVRLSAGQAWRFPTVGELYQVVTVGTLLANPNPDLQPERARSIELAVERRDDKGSVRLSLFNEVIANALISQMGTVSGTTTSQTFVQNVDETRARGVELALDRRDILPGVDISGSLTYADAITSRNNVFPASVGKLLPSVPHWKSSAVITWRPVERLSLTTGARFASRNWATLDNIDHNGNTWQGFARYFVVDVRAVYTLTDHLELAAGIDNVNNDKYFLFHPFPQRSYTASLGWKL